MEAGWDMTLRGWCVHSRAGVCYAASVMSEEGEAYGTPLETKPLGGSRVPSS
jgi:hypothetical protein